MLLFEGFDLLDVVHEVLDLVEHRQRLRGDHVAGHSRLPQLFFDAHRQLDRVQRVEAVLRQRALERDVRLVGRPEVVSHQRDHEPAR